ncbi:hypothetical protein [Cellulomonas soli]
MTEAMPRRSIASVVQKSRPDVSAAFSSRVSRESRSSIAASVAVSIAVRIVVPVLVMRTSSGGLVGVLAHRPDY